MSMAVNYGTANASPIIALESAGNYDKRVQVTLTATYVRSLPGGAAAGYIDPNPSQVGNRVTTTGVPSTFSSGPFSRSFLLRRPLWSLRRRLTIDQEMLCPGRSGAALNLGGFDGGRQLG